MTLSHCVAKAALESLSPFKIRITGHSTAGNDSVAIPATCSAMHGRSDTNAYHVTLISSWRPARHGEHAIGVIDSGVANH